MNHRLAAIICLPVAVAALAGCSGASTKAVPGSSAGTKPGTTIATIVDKKVQWCRQYTELGHDFESALSQDPASLQSAATNIRSGFENLASTAPDDLSGPATTLSAAVTAGLDVLKAAAWDSSKADMAALTAVSGSAAVKDASSTLDKACNYTPLSDQGLVAASATTFAATLAQMATSGMSDYTVSGDIGDETDTDPRKSVYLLRMLDNTLVPDQSVATTDLVADSTRVLVYNGGHGDKAIWTRLTCGTASSAECMVGGGSYDNDASSGLVAGTPGKLPGVYSGSKGKLVCLLLHKSSEDVFIGWNGVGSTADASTQAVVSADIAYACGDTFAESDTVPVSDSGAGSYYDFAGSRVSDPTWAP